MGSTVTYLKISSCGAALDSHHRLTHARAAPTATTYRMYFAVLEVHS
jgi:hypothetical protein